MWAWLLFTIFGPCALPCDQPGTKLYNPHSNSRPIYLCTQHYAEVSATNIPDGEEHCSVTGIEGKSSWPVDEPDTEHYDPKTDRFGWL
jgi:hypothetical protein